MAVCLFFADSVGAEMPARAAGRAGNGCRYEILEPRIDINDSPLKAAQMQIENAVRTCTLGTLRYLW